MTCVSFVRSIVSCGRVAGISLCLALQLAHAETPSSKNSATATKAPVIHGVMLDSILATVGEEVILFSDLQKVVTMASNGQTKLESSGKLTGAPFKAESAQQLLDQLIDQKLITLKARELGLAPSADELETEIQNFLKQRGLTPEKLVAELSAGGESLESYREEFRKELEMQRYIGRAIRPLVSVTDEEARNYYVQQTGASDKLKKVKLRSLSIEIPPTLDSAQRVIKSQTIDEIRQKIDSKAEFSALVKLYSEDRSNAEKGGELPPRSISEFPEAIRERLRKVTSGEVIGPIVLGSTTFFFQYLGSTLDDMSAFEKEKSMWEQKILDIKIKERMEDQVRAERSKVRVVKMPFKIQ